jgi:hypothetical protein
MSDGVDTQTPNFAMDTSDVDLNAPAEVKRYSTHLFDPSDPSFFGDSALPSGTPLRVSETFDWPPAILFDAVYASTVLHHFGVQTLKEELAATWQDTFYPDGIMNQAQADQQAITNARAATMERKEMQVQECQARADAHACTHPDTFDMLLALPYILVPRNELQAVLREAKEKAAAAEQRRVQEKVDTWSRQVITS